MTDITSEVTRVLESAYAELDEEERLVFGKVLEIEHTYRNQTHPRGVVEDIERALERIVVA